MSDYEKIRQMAEKLASEEVEVLKSYISQNERSIMLEGLKNLHREKMVESRLPPEEYKKIFEIAVENAKKDLDSLLKGGDIWLPEEKKAEFLGNKITKCIEELLLIKSPELVQKLSEKQLSEEKFILLNCEDYFYEKLESEINICYTCGAYTAVLILGRKLIENLLIDVLRRKYGDDTLEDVEIYFSTNLGRFHDFTILLKNFSERKADFRIDKDLINQFFELVGPFRKDANKKTHSIIHLIEKKEELESYNIQRLASLLMKLLSNISSRD